MKYAFSTYKMKVEGHEFWVAESTVLKGCVAQDDSLDNAIRELELNEKEWIETANECGIEIPTQSARDSFDYSGKLSLRISKTMHETIAQLSDEDGVSINTFISNAIAEKIGKLKSEVHIYMNTTEYKIKIENFESFASDWKGGEHFAVSRINS